MTLDEFITTVIKADAPPYVHLARAICSNHAALEMLAEVSDRPDVAPAMLAGVAATLHNILEYGVPTDLEYIAHGEGPTCQTDTHPLQG